MWSFADRVKSPSWKWPKLCSQERPLDDIAGLSWKSNGRRIHNLDRHVEPLDALPIPAFDLTDFDAYEKLSGARKIGYATSVGCPYACNYCTDMVFYKRRFNALSAERVVSELTDLVTRYRIEEVALLDSNFPVQLARALEIARGITRIRRQVPLDLPGLNRLPMPHERRRSASCWARAAYRTWALAPNRLLNLC